MIGHMPAGKADEVAARRVQVAALTLEGKNQSAIAKLLGRGSTTIHRDILALRLEWRAARTRDTEEAAGEELARIAAIEAAIWPEVIKGSYPAIDRWLKLSDRRGRILGTDEPIKIDLTDRLRALAEKEGLDADELIAVAEGIIATG